MYPYDPFVSPSGIRRAVVSYWRKYVHEVLVNRLGGLSLPRKSVVRLTDRPDMTLDDPLGGGGSCRIFRMADKKPACLFFFFFPKMPSENPIINIFCLCYICFEQLNHEFHHVNHNFLLKSQRCMFVGICIYPF